MRPAIQEYIAFSGRFNFSIFSYLRVFLTLALIICHIYQKSFHTNPTRIGLFEMDRLQQNLSEILDKKVDLTIPDALNKAMKDRIIKETLRAA